MQTYDSIFGQGAILVAQREVEALFAFTERISAEGITDITVNCADTPVNDEFTQLVQTAEAAVMAALDDVDGEAHKQFDTALDELRQARQEFFRPITKNRVNCHLHADNARRAFEAGVAEFAE